MPANLPPDARKKWAEVEETKNPVQRILRMEEFLSLVPKHKGTLKLRGQVKKQMAVLRKEIDEKKHKRVGKSGSRFFLEKEGAAQIAIIGLTNSGKSSLLAAVTNAKPVISPAPYSTREPLPGILSYEDIGFQMIEAPALMEGAAEGRSWGLQTLGIARNSDGLIITVDLSRSPIDQLALITSELEKAHIKTTKPEGKVEVERRHAGVGLRIILVGTLVDCSMHDVEQLLKAYNLKDAVIKVSGRVSLDDIEDAIFGNMVYKPTIIVANKNDLAGSVTKLLELLSTVGGKLPVISASALNKTGLDNLGEILFRTLDIIRVYTKEPEERKASKKPFILRKSASVRDLAKSIHSDFRERFNFARVWSRRLIFSPQKVGLDFTLADGDVIEIHLR